MASKLTQWINASLKNKGMTAKQAQKNAYKYKSIAAAKKAGSLYYKDKNGKIMIAAYAEDLNNIPKVKPKDRPKADRKDGLLSKSGNPTQGPGNRGMREKKITTTTLPKTSTARPTPIVAPPVKPSQPVQPSGGGNGKAKPTTNSAKLDAWKAGDKSLSSKEQFRLAKWAARNDLSVPRDLAKDRVRLSLKTSTSKNKGGPVTKKPKGAYAAGGMPMVMKAGKKVPAFAADGVGKMNMGGMAAKKKPAAKKMMAGGMATKKKPAAKKMIAGGMTKKSGYMYGGMAKKKMKK
jgi:hypothetical protein